MQSSTKEGGAMNKRAYTAKKVLSIVVLCLGIAILLTFAIFAIFGQKIAP